MSYSITVRPRRQITFPSSLLQKLGLEVGDRLAATVKNEQIILKPQKRAALDAFRAIQKAFAESGIPEKEMQDNLKKIRKEIYLEQYGKSISR